MSTDDISQVAWYHTIELSNGVLTPGLFDTRRAVRKLPFPESLAGMRCLDVGTADGFWAFEMERRGADEVVAIDVDDTSRRDWPWDGSRGKSERMGGRGSAFSIAHRELGSKVQRKDLSIYDCSEAEIGTFDFVFIGSLLLHLRDPVRALAAVRSVTRGELLVGDTVSLSLSILHPFDAVTRVDARRKPRWSIPNRRALNRWVAAAGFDIVKTGGPYRVPAGPGYPRLSRLFVRLLRGDLKAFRGLGGTLIPRLGIPHAWVIGRPSNTH